LGRIPAEKSAELRVLRLWLANGGRMTGKGDGRAADREAVRTENAVRWITVTAGLGS
jgi:hypothetical protein